MIYTNEEQAALEAFKAKQVASWRTFRTANPELMAEMKQAISYDMALRRQAFFNGQPVPKHFRA